MKRRQKIRKGIILLSFFLFPAIFYYLSPYLIIEAARQNIINGSFILFLLLFAGSLFLGRAFCGWVCPAAGCQEAIIPSREKKVNKGNVIKWVLWVPWIGIIFYQALSSGGYTRVSLLYGTTHGLSIGDAYGLIMYLMVLLIIVVPAFVIGKRSFCHHLCWMAPFMILGRKLRNLGKWPSLQLKAETIKCTHCHTCRDHCPMSLSVDTMVKKGQMEHEECILCGTCVDGCRNKVITFTVARPTQSK